MATTGARAFAILGCLAAALLAGCTAADIGSVVEATPVDEAVALSQPALNAPYVLATGDQITVRFYYNPQLDEDLTIRPDGNISLSLIGELKATGKTPEQLSMDITAAYAEYLEKPTGIVLVRAFANARVFVAGEVAHPGLVDMTHGYQTVAESIASSGGFLETSDLGSVVLVRRVPDRPQPIVVKLNLADAIRGRDTRDDLELLPNDLVYVPRSGAASVNLAMRLYILNNFGLSSTANVTGTKSFDGK